MTSRLAFDFTAPSKLSAKTRPITRLQRLFPLPILPWHFGLVLRFMSIYDNWKIWNDYWGTGYIPVFTVWKYLVGGIYQREDLKLKSVKISVQGLFKYLGCFYLQCVLCSQWKAVTSKFANFTVPLLTAFLKAPSQSVSSNKQELVARAIECALTPPPTPPSPKTTTTTTTTKNKKQKKHQQQNWHFPHAFAILR